jgi:hypothetical protein
MPAGYPTPLYKWWSGNLGVPVGENAGILFPFWWRYAGRPEAPPKKGEIRYARAVANPGITSALANPGTRTTVAQPD